MEKSHSPKTGIESVAGKSVFIDVTDPRSCLTKWNLSLETASAVYM